MRLKSILLISTCILGAEALYSAEVLHSQTYQKPSEQQLWNAIDQNDVAKVSQLVQEGINVRIEDETQSSPLHHALEIEDSEIAKSIADILIKAGAQLETPINIFGNKPIQSRHQELIEDLKNLYNQTKQVANKLWSSVREDNIDALTKMLAQHPFSINVFNKQGNTPLHGAAFKGAEEILALLLERHANRLLPTPLGAIPLHYAALQGHSPSVRLLLEKNPTEQLTTVDASNNTPLHMALQNSNSETAKSIAKELLLYGANLYAPNTFAQTPLNIAAEQHGSQVAEELESTVDNLFFDAVVKGDNDSVQSLINSGYPRLFAATTNGKTALQIAQEHGNKELAETLSQLSTDPITADELSQLDPSELIAYNKQFWTKKSLFNSAFNAITKDASDLLDPFTRQPLPTTIIWTLRDYFNLSNNDYRELISAKKQADQLRGSLSIEGLGSPVERADIQQNLEALDKRINDYLAQIGVL